MVIIRETFRKCTSASLCLAKNNPNRALRTKDLSLIIIFESRSQISIHFRGKLASATWTPVGWIYRRYESSESPESGLHKICVAEQRAKAMSVSSRRQPRPQDSS
ncbi:hypothetical protein TEQG_03225 [Trichophyton equinum CBS 127.97]|uniref:Uncharacterized protein n=1 Tax=Trichophyton equinum (strain ATCC MYA-4606 / CBS 127.97) TaxID=559882 RepID=F2PQM6_TRIEC|nr:hypothetical protein TEQG_03225 [Trichophyton equinum CBS 127.97]